MCSLAFFGFLRIGEITATTNAGCQPLQLHQISYVYGSSKHVVGFTLTFLDFKHHYNQRPFTLSLQRQHSCCPIALLLDYLALRIMPLLNGLTIIYQARVRVRTCTLELLDLRK